MHTLLRHILAWQAVIILSAAQAVAQAYRWTDELQLLTRIDKLPEYRTASYVEQFSSYDRTGGNDDGFNGTYSFLRKEAGGLVIAETEGPGVICRMWTPTPNDNLLHFYFDGEAQPRLSIRFSDLFSGKVAPFLKPVCGNEVGGYYCYLPLTYRKSCKIVYEGEKLEFIQIEYRNLPGKDVRTFDGITGEADRALLDSVCRTWADIHPKMQTYLTGLSAGAQAEETRFTLNPGEEHTFFSAEQAGRITGIEIDAGAALEGLHKDVILSARWDGQTADAIHAPAADFFGYAFGKAAMRSIVMGRQGTTNYCFLPMPFDRSATLKLVYLQREGSTQPPISVKAKVYYNRNGRNKHTEGRFYAVWNRQETPLGEFHRFLSHKGKGHYVGTIHEAQGLRAGMTLFFEGDDSTYVDGKMRLHGTGSEDYYNGGWYALLDRWDRGNSLPVHGCLDYSLPMGRTGGYRFFLNDKMSFEKEIYHAIEHGPEHNNFPVDYTSMAFLYSDTPPADGTEPTEDLRTVYLPSTHIYFPQLMKLTPDGDITIRFNRGIRMNTQSTGRVRIMLDDVPEGTYRVTLNYFEKPNGADFCVWQRQKQLSEWVSTKSEGEHPKDNIYVGQIELTEQTNSLTFHVRSSNGNSEFELNLITLERINTNEPQDEP